MDKATKKARPTAAKDQEIEEILGAKGDKKAAKAAKGDKPAKGDKGDKPTKAAKAEKPAKGDKPAKAEKPAKGDKPAKVAKERVREPVVFEEGEREKLEKRVATRLGKADKKGINSKELAAALEVKTRKLRPVLYAMERAGTCKLKPGESRAAGMTVLPA